MVHDKQGEIKSLIEIRSNKCIKFALGVSMYKTLEQLFSFQYFLQQHDAKTLREAIEASPLKLVNSTFLGTQVR